MNTQRTTREITRSIQRAQGLYLTGILGMTITTIIGFLVASQNWLLIGWAIGFIVILLAGIGKSKFLDELEQHKLKLHHDIYGAARDHREEGSITLSAGGTKDDV